MKSAASGSCVTALSGCKIGWEVEGLSACSSDSRPGHLTSFADCCVFFACCGNFCTACVQGAGTADVGWSKQHLDGQVHHSGVQAGTAQQAVTSMRQGCPLVQQLKECKTLTMANM